MGKIDEGSFEKEKIVLEKLQHLRDMIGPIEINSTEIIRETRKERLKG